MQLNHIRRHQGFTLIEIIMVVVIMGLMAIFIIPNYTKSVSKSYERAGLNNLTIIYAAQKIKYNSGDGYKALGDTNAINNTLGLGIIGNGINYDCNCTVLPTCSSAAATFTCDATRTGTGGFTLRVNSNNDICCAAGTCPSVATGC